MKHLAFTYQWIPLFSPFILNVAQSEMKVMASK